MSMFSSFNNTTGNDESQRQVFRGSLMFRRNTMSFFNHTLLLSNISQFKQYSLIYKKRISWFLYIISILLFTLMLLLFVLLFLQFTLTDNYAEHGEKIYIYVTIGATLFFGRIVYIGYLERQIPRLYGLTVELNSGNTHHFSSKDEEGISNLFNIITEAAEQDEPINQTFHFEGDKVVNTGPVGKQVNFSDAGRDLHV